MDNTMITPGEFVRDVMRAMKKADDKCPGLANAWMNAACGQPNSKRKYKFKWPDAVEKPNEREES